MSNEKSQLPAEYEEYNAKIENAKSEEEATAIFNEYFPANSETVEGGELTEEQLESVAGGHVTFKAKKPGVPIFNKPGGKIVGVLKFDQEVYGSTSMWTWKGQTFINVTDINGRSTGTVFNKMHLSDRFSCPLGQH